MFTGLIQDVGKIVAVRKTGPQATVAVETALRDFVTGESIAVMGACLSVVSFAESRFFAFASAETLSKTGLGELGHGARVNLERAARLGDPVGGHFVSGHVDTRVQLLEKRNVGDAIRLSFSLPGGPLAKQIAAKGSVAIDGVSLTVNQVTQDRFDVMVIPLTLQHTTLDQTFVGALVNIETDVLAKYVARRLEPGGASGGVDMDLLLSSGFAR